MFVVVVHRLSRLSFLSFFFCITWHRVHRLLNPFTCNASAVLAARRGITRISRLRCRRISAPLDHIVVYSHRGRGDRVVGLSLDHLCRRGCPRGGRGW